MSRSNFVVCFILLVHTSGVFGQTMMGPYWLYDNNHLTDKYIINPAFTGNQYDPNKDEVIWNLGLSKRFLKNNSGTLSLQWTDILQQRKNISRSITANYIEDGEYRALTSYVLVSFTYRFNNTPSGNKK